MPDAGTLLWLLAVVGGPIALAAALAYAIMRRKERTFADRAETERGAREVYDEEERRV